jgi:putative ABC transport system ATP-binding protein
VAIARALITQPEVVFADEPTGALDTVTAREILKLLRHTVDSTGQTTVMVTHDPVAASYADSVIFLADGRIAEIAPGQSADQIADRMTHLGAWA